MDNIMFAEVNFPLLDKSTAAKEILAIPEKFSFWDEYRNTLMIPLMSKGGMSASNSIPGEFKWNDGSIYYGAVRNDLLNGQGTYIWSDGKEYKGQWKDNMKNGLGKEVYQDQSIYEGTYVNNKRHISGKLMKSNKEYYEGEFDNNLIDGKGKYNQIY